VVTRGAREVHVRIERAWKNKTVVLQGGITVTKAEQQ
jgi:hypothetical protein